MSYFDAAWPHLTAFHHRNGTKVEYLPPGGLSRSRLGVIETANPPPAKEIRVLMDWNPTPEQVTAFGDPSSAEYGRKAIFRVLAADLEPLKEGSFRFGGKTYSILANPNPLWRGGKLFRYDCLVGYE